MVKLAVRNITRNLRRSLLCAFAIAVSAMAIVLLFALIDGMEADMRDNLVKYYTGEIRIRSSGYAEHERYRPLYQSLDYATITAVLDRMDEVAASSGRIEFPLSIYLGERSRPAVGLGLDFEREHAFSNLGTILTDGRLPTGGTNELLLGAALAKSLGTNIGERLTLLASTAAGSTNAMSFTVVGIVTPPIGALSASALYLDLERAQRLLHMEGQVQQIVVRAISKAPLSPLAARIAADIFTTVGIEVESKTFSQINELFALFLTARLIYYAIALVFFILGSTVIINTTMMVIYERMAEIGMMKAMGMQDGEVRLLFLLEGAFISAVGALVGVLVALLIAYLLGKRGIDFTEAMSGVDMEISSVLYPRTNVRTSIGIYVYGVLIATLATIAPTRRAAKIQVVEALNYV